MDLVIKKYFDAYRGKSPGLPPELVGRVQGTLMPDLELMEKWRNWRTGLVYRDKQMDALLFGALDDCLRDGEYYIPLDYKTRGSAPAEGDSEKYYQTQLDVYAFLLNTNGYKVGNFAYLVYYYPEEVCRNGLVKFNIKPVKVNTGVDRAEKTFRSAVALLAGPMPAHHSDCEYCSWVSDRSEFE